MNEEYFTCKHAELDIIRISAQDKMKNTYEMAWFTVKDINSIFYPLPFCI